MGHRPLNMGDLGVWQPGTPAPGAESWPRVDAWVKARYLVLA